MVCFEKNIQNFNPKKFEESVSKIISNTSPIKLIDAMIYPSLNQVLSIENVCLHIMGQTIFKEATDKVYSSILNECSKTDNTEATSI